MPNALERRLRDARPSPPASAEARRLAARRVVLEERAAGRSRRWGGWGLLRPALGVLGLVAAVGLVAVLLVAGPTGGDDPTGLRFADQEEAGAALRLTVDPVHPGVSAEQVAEGAAAVLRARAAALGVVDLEAVSAAGGTVQMWVPASAAEGTIDALLDPARLSFSNTARVVLGRNFATPGAALRSPNTNRVRLPGTTFYVVDRATGGLVRGPTATRREAEAAAGPGRGWHEVIALPPGVVIVRDLVEGGWKVIGEGPAVGGAGIVRLEPAPGGVRAILSRPMPHQVGRRSVHAPGPELMLLVEGGRRPVPELAGTNRDSNRSLTGALSVEFSVREEIRPRLVALFADGELPARLRVDARAATGR